MRRFFLDFATVPDLFPREGGEGEGGEGAGAGEGGEGSGGSGGEGSGHGAGLLTGKTGGGEGGEGGQGGEGGEGGFQIPEKFLVKNAEGKEDWEAIVKKTLPAYATLEKRFGAGEAPPESADKYKIEDYLPEGYERNAEAEKAILTELHGLGLSNKQAQGVLSYYGQLLGKATADEKAAMDSAMETLKGQWKENYDKNMDRANFALSSLADEATVQEITTDPRMMNNPALIRLLAKMGEELEDDKSVNEMSAGEIEDIEQLRRSDAYLDEKHADHKRVVDKVKAAYARGYKDKH